jgi:hypothetical protein
MWQAYGSRVAVRLNGYVNNPWLTLLVIDDPAVTPQAVAAALHAAGMEGRPAWKPMHLQLVFANAPFVTADAVY